MKLVVKEVQMLWRFRVEPSSPVGHQENPQAPWFGRQGSSSLTLAVPVHSAPYRRHQDRLVRGGGDPTGLRSIRWVQRDASAGETHSADRLAYRCPPRLPQCTAATQGIPSTHPQKACPTVFQ